MKQQLTKGISQPDDECAPFADFSSCSEWQLTSTSYSRFNNAPEVPDMAECSKAAVEGGESQGAPSKCASQAKALTDYPAQAVYRGFVPCLLRAFPTNASALFVWETSMRLMGAEQLSQ